MNLNISEINNKIEEPLTDSDLIYFLGKNVKDNIIKFSDLENYKSIEKLLPTDRSYKIILIENTHNVGHWVVILRYDKTIEYFNSYGTNPINDLNYVENNNNIVLNQSKQYIKKLLNDAINKNYIVIYNKKRFQKLKSSINTCGRHVVSRIIAMTKLNLDLEKYINLLDKYKRKYKITYDQAITLIV